MELLGTKKCFESLQNENVSISTFVSDRYLGIAKWIKDHQRGTQHFYDIWHVARSICKKVTQAAKEKGFERLQLWVKGIKRHLYWCILSTRRGFGALIFAKWASIIRHIANKHHGHDDPLFPKCKHQDLERRKYIKIGRYIFAFSMLQTLDSCFRQRIELLHLLLDLFEIAIHQKFILKRHKRSKMSVVYHYNEYRILISQVLNSQILNLESSPTVTNFIRCYLRSTIKFQVHQHMTNWTRF